MSTAADRSLWNKALIAGLAVIACVWVARLPGMAVGLAYLGPAIFVFLLLRFGRYPGEKALLALIRPRLPRRTGRVRTLGRGFRAALPRGGELLAGSLAGRAPPRAPLD
jgi:hypothetical protein